MYVDILKVLVHLGPQNLFHLMKKTNIGCIVLKAQLDFLVTQGFVDEQLFGRQKGIYSITLRGVTVLKYFKVLKQELPIIKKTRSRESSRL
jgi:predicted transcriptional regulator